MTASGQPLAVFVFRPHTPPSPPCGERVGCGRPLDGKLSRSTRTLNPTPTCPPPSRGRNPDARSPFDVKQAPSTKSIPLKGGGQVGVGQTSAQFRRIPKRQTQPNQPTNPRQLGDGKTSIPTPTDLSDNAPVASAWRAVAMFNGAGAMRSSGQVRRNAASQPTTGEVRPALKRMGAVHRGLGMSSPAFPPPAQDPRGETPP